MNSLTTLLIAIATFAVVSRAQFGQQFDVSPDCDAHFARTATQLAASKVDDPVTLANIETILSSCNKSPIQKMTEASVFLLDKGTISPKIMHEMKEVYDKMQKLKIGSIARHSEHIPKQLEMAFDELKTIVTSPALSPNERSARTGQLLQSIPAQYRKTLNEAVSPSEGHSEDVRILHGTRIEATENPLRITTEPSMQAEVGNPNANSNVLPPSFPVEAEREKESQVLFSTNSGVSARNQIPIPFAPNFGSGIPNIPQVPFAAQGSFPFQQNQNHNQQPISPQSPNALFPDLGIISTNARRVTQELGGFVNKNTGRVEGFIKALAVQPNSGTNLRPASVGVVEHSSKMDDANLLNPRNSLWSEAANFLSQTTLNLPSKISALIDSGKENTNPRTFSQQALSAPSFVPYVPSNTFPLPAEAYQHAFRSGVESNRGMKWEETLQNDAPMLPSRPASGLETYDTHVSRFAASGPSNRFVIPGNVAEMKIPTNYLAPSFTANQPQSPTSLFNGHRQTLPARMVSAENSAVPIATLAPAVAVGYPTYPPPPAIVPTVVNSQPAYRMGEKTPEMITGTYKQIGQQFNQRINGQLRKVKVDLWNEH